MVMINLEDIPSLSGFQRNTPEHVSLSGAGGWSIASPLAVRYGNTQVLSIPSPRANWNRFLWHRLTPKTCAGCWSGFLGAFLVFFGLVSLRADAPPPALTISDIPDQTILEDGNLIVRFFVFPQAKPSDVPYLIGTSSSNTNLIPRTTQFVVNEGDRYALILRPASNQSGDTTITVTAAPIKNGPVTSVFFRITIIPVNDPPRLLFPQLSAIARAELQDLRKQKGLRTLENTASAPLDFRVYDEETPAEQLIITLDSTNRTLIPRSNIVMTGTSTDRSLIMTPTLDQTGITEISVTASDGELSVTYRFPVTVQLASKIVAWQRLADGRIQIRFRGEVDRNYRLQAATEVTGSWENVMSVNGNQSFGDYQELDPTFPRRFYRVISF
jgi:hypothetical protein